MFKVLPYELGKKIEFLLENPHHFKEKFIYFVFVDCIDLIVSSLSLYNFDKIPNYFVTFFSRKTKKFEKIRGLLKQKNVFFVLQVS